MWFLHCRHSSLDPVRQRLMMEYLPELGLHCWQVGAWWASESGSPLALLQDCLTKPQCYRLDLRFRRSLRSLHYLCPDRHFFRDHLEFANFEVPSSQQSQMIAHSHQLVIHRGPRVSLAVQLHPDPLDRRMPPLLPAMRCFPLQRGHEAGQRSVEVEDNRCWLRTHIRDSNRKVAAVARSTAATVDQSLFSHSWFHLQSPSAVLFRMSDKPDRLLAEAVFGPVASRLLCHQPPTRWCPISQTWSNTTVRSSTGCHCSYRCTDCPLEWPPLGS